MTIINLLSWNMQQKTGNWQTVLESRVDVAMLQEAKAPPEELKSKFIADWEGEWAEPWPEELPEDSLNVPTFHSNRQTPGSATRQLDFVFASESIADRVKVKALNGIEEWGPSDHCRIMIELYEQG